MLNPMKISDLVWSDRLILVGVEKTKNLTID